jgi:hypothetical protein
MRHILVARHGVSGQIAPYYPFPLWKRRIKGDLCAWRAVFIATEQWSQLLCKRKSPPIPSFPKRGIRNIQLV